jgi:hypothetical protein
MSNEANEEISHIKVAEKLNPESESAHAEG